MAWPLSTAYFLATDLHGLSRTKAVFLDTLFPSCPSCPSWFTHFDGGFRISLLPPFPVNKKKFVKMPGKTFFVKKEGTDKFFNNKFMPIRLLFFKIRYKIWIQ